MELSVNGLSPMQANKNRQHDVARNEMLKLILVSCSQTLFVTPGENPSNINLKVYPEP